MNDEITTARFFRKPSHIRDLTDNTPIIKPAPFRVVKVIELSAAQYGRFINGFMVEMPFITANRELMKYDEKTGCFQCLMVHCRELSEAILVDAEGFDYARYAAFILDKSRVNLRDVPVERYNLKTRGSRGGHER